VSTPELVYSTPLGNAWHGDSLELLDGLEPESINLVCTSPPFPLTRQKAYGNEPEDEYVAWFRKFAEAVKPKLAEDGSFVIDLGGAWLPGSATRSLYQYRLLIQLVDEVGFHLAEDYYWFNRAKLPGPRQWVNIERTRVKDAVNVIWWLSKTENPKADNRRALRPYSKSMQRMIKRGTYNDGDRPAQHKIGKDWAKDQGGAIAPNVIETEYDDPGYDWRFGFEPDNMLDYPNTVSGDAYLQYCRAYGISPHPARFPREVPETFIKLLTEPGDLVVDIFGGSNMTGYAAELHGRRWVSCDMEKDYVAGSIGRFPSDSVTVTDAGRALGIPHGLSPASPVPVCRERCCMAEAEAPPQSDGAPVSD
jgi:DNA modification methylase